MQTIYSIRDSVRITLGFALLTLLPTAYAADIGKHYSNREYWRMFAWDETAKSPLWLDPGFRPYKGAGEKGDRYYANQTVSIEGTSYVASLAEFDLRIQYKDFTTIATKAETRSDCERLIGSWRKIFGTENIYADNSYSLVPNVHLSELAWQWDIGRTRVTARCISIAKPIGAFDGFHLEYQAMTDEHKLVAPIRLQCLRTYVLSSEQSSSGKNTAQPLGFLLIPAHKVMVDADKLPMGAINSMTGSTISLVMNTEKLVNNYEIDRATGILTGTAKDKASNMTVARYDGQCERRQSDELKF